jgi:translation initiation factor 3 subunit C
MSDDEEEETKRVVRTAREKRYEALENIIHAIRNSKKIKDFTKMETGFVDLAKAFEKAKPVIEKEENGVTPRFYIRILIELEDMVNETWEDRDGRKKMSKNNSKSLSALRQKLRKYIKDFDDDMAKFRENPDAADHEEAVDEDAAKDADDDANDDEVVGPVATVSKKKSKSATPGGDDDDSDDSYWDSDSDDSSSSSSDDNKGMSLRDKFLKKTTSKAEEKQEKKEKKAEKGRKKDRRKIVEEDEGSDEDDDWIKVDRGAVDKPKMFEKDAEINHDLVVKKLREIMAARGKKRTNRKEQIELLTELYNISEEHTLGIGMAIKIKFAIVAAIFDYNPKISAAMKPEYWEKCMPSVEHLLQIVEDHPELQTGDGIVEDAESLEIEPYKVRGCYLAAVERLNEEFHKVLKGCDAHSNEYVDRLKDEERVMAILEKAQALLERTKIPSEICRIFLQRIDHIYFKFDPTVIKQKNVSSSKKNSIK